MLRGRRTASWECVDSGLLYILPYASGRFRAWHSRIGQRSPEVQDRRAGERVTTRGEPRPWGTRSAADKALPSQHQRSGCSRTKPSERAHPSVTVHCARSTMSNGSRPGGSTGTATDARTPLSGTPRPTSTKPHTTRGSERHLARRWRPHRNGRESGAVEISEPAALPTANEVYGQ